MQVDRGALHGVAAEAAREWPAERLAMAIRALRLDDSTESLESIASEFGVSRETVRRVRNELVRRVEVRGDQRPEAIAIIETKPVEQTLGGPNPATARALRRLLTMTGPLAWDELLASWARAGGKPPYGALPADLLAFRAWAEEAGGLIVSDEVSPSVATVEQEELDQVSRFLVTALAGKRGGIDRTELLAATESAGLRPTTIATTLSMHPAIVRVGRGTWALRGHVAPVAATEALQPRRTVRLRPTTFDWAADGALQLTFSSPRGPSPVLSVPKVVGALIEGRAFTAADGDKPARIVVKGGKLWGFAPLVSIAGLHPGARGVLSLNLIAGTATLRAADRKG